MKRITRNIAGMCLALLLTLQPAATAKAEPLTIIAIAGFSLVAAAGAFDTAFVDHHNDNKDMRAQVRDRGPNRDEIAPVVQTDPDLGYFAHNGHANDTGGVAVGESHSVHGYYGNGVSGSSGD